MTHEATQDTSTSICSGPLSAVPLVSPLWRCSSHVPGLIRRIQGVKVSKSLKMSQNVSKFMYFMFPSVSTVSLGLEAHCILDVHYPQSLATVGVCTSCLESHHLSKIIPNIIIPINSYKYNKFTIKFYVQIASHTLSLHITSTLSTLRLTGTRGPDLCFRGLIRGARGLPPEFRLENADGAHVACHAHTVHGFFIGYNWCNIKQSCYY